MVSNPLTDPNWAARMVDLIDRVVGTIRRYTTQPLVALARGIVFGLLGAFGVIAVLVLVIVSLTRGLQAALDVALSRASAVWISYFVLAAIFTIVGTVLMSRRFSDDEDR